LGLQIEAAFNAIHHGLGDGNLYGSVCPSADGIDDIDIYLGSGGAPEGVLAAAAAKEY
jgi:fructose-1,6-bisphosphatase/sedoheptulose 1,7-bisphosphatase-like protein